MSDDLQVTLDDLADVPVVVDIARPDGRTVRVPMRALSENEVFELRKRIDWPKPPTTNFTKSGPVLDYQDKGYRDALNECNRKLSYLILVHSLRISIAGEAEDEKAATLQGKLGNYAYTQLLEASNRLNVVGEEDLAKLARSFRTVGTAQPSGDAAPGNGAVSLVEAAAT